MGPHLTPNRSPPSICHVADVAVAFRNLKELPPDDAVMHLPDTEPPEAPPAGVHYVGDRVKVCPSHGVPTECPPSAHRVPTECSLSAH